MNMLEILHAALSRVCLPCSPGEVSTSGQGIRVLGAASWRAASAMAAYWTAIMASTSGRPSTSGTVMPSLRSMVMVESSRMITAGPPSMRPGR